MAEETLSAIASPSRSNRVCLQGAPPGTSRASVRGQVARVIKAERSHRTAVAVESAGRLVHMSWPLQGCARNPGNT